MAGKWWTIVVVAVGFGVLTYTVLAVMAYVIEGHLGDAFESRRMRRRVARMTGHYIVCGFGRVGREIADEFTAEKIAFVVVDSNEDSLRRAAAAGFSVVHGNAADVETLKAAGAERARGLVTAVDSDADNIYVTLSARVLKPDLFIVARANRPDAEPKLRLAGANRVVSPYTMGGRRLASLAMRPTAVEFVDTILSATNGELLLEDFTIQAGSRWVGRPLGTLVAEADEAIVLALKRAGRLIFRPAAGHRAGARATSWSRPARRPRSRPSKAACSVGRLRRRLEARSNGCTASANQPRRRPWNSNRTCTSAATARRR